jgi:hypothetical protein
MNPKATNCNKKNEVPTKKSNKKGSRKMIELG